MTDEAPAALAAADDPISAFIVDTSRDLFELRMMLVLTRVHRPEARTIVIITPGTDIAVAESARELADEVVEGHLDTLTEAEREALFARAKDGFENRDPVLPEQFVRRLGLLLAHQGKVSTSRDEDVERAILDIVLPVQERMGHEVGMSWLAEIAIQSWNCTLLTDDERNAIVDDFATRLSASVDPNLTRTLFSSLGGRKRRAFPDDKRWIVDYDVRTIDGELRVMVCVCDAAAMHIVQPSAKSPKKKKKPKQLKGLEIQIASPLLMHTALDRDRTAREFGVSDPELARVLGNVAASFLEYARDLEQYKLHVTLAAGAWNASQLKPDGTERFIQRLTEQLPDDFEPEYYGHFLRTLCAERLRQYPYDHRAILGCDVRVKGDGGFEIEVMRVKGGFKF